MNDVGQWLERLGLIQYAAVFAANDVDGEVLARLTEEDLEKFGVSLDHREKLLRAISALAREHAEPRLEAHAPMSRSAEGERRQLTLIFCDLVGSTALSTQLDVEDLSDVIHAFHQFCAEIIELHEGYVAKYMGDGILAYFGYPRAGEDDAERAVRAGLAMVNAVGNLTVGHGLRLQLRVGIATGPVVVGQFIGEGTAREAGVIGETPNLAARLLALAAPNTVVIGVTTHRLVGGMFDCEDLGHHELKGFAKPVRAWRVVLESSTEGRFGVRKAAGLAPLVDRATELDLLIGWWRESKSGRGRVALVRGEAGVGKSRLAQEFERRLDEDQHVSLRYHCSPHHRNTALHPVIDQLERAAGFVPDDLPERKLAKLEGLLAPSLVAVRETAPLLAALLSIPTGGRYPPIELGPRRQKERILQAVVDQLTGLVEYDPALLVFEDAHWIDPTSQELLEMLVDRLASLRVLAVVTCRPEFRASWRDRSHVTELLLDRLGQSDSAAIAQSLSSKALPPEVLTRIVAKTDGIPLFVEELTKTVMESGLLRDAGNRYALDDPLPPLAIPATLHDSLLARLDRLGPAKAVAQIAACIGRDFSNEVLSVVAPVSGEELHGALNRLVASGLVIRQDARSAGNYAFRHALLRDAAYSTLLRTRRQHLHGLIGEAIEHLFGDRLDEFASVLAHHFEQANARQKAAFYFERAGERAAVAFANAEAIAFYKAALAQAELLLGFAAEQRDRWQASSTNLREKIGDVLSVTGQHEEARDIYQLALNGCAEGGRELRARLYRKIGQTWARQRQNHRQALIAYTEAEAVLGSEPAEDVTSWQQEWLQIQLERLVPLYLENDIREMERLIVQIRPLIGQHGSPAQRGQFYHGVVAAAYRRDRYVVSDETLRANKASVDAYREAGTLSEPQCLAQFSLGFSHLWRSEFDQAEVALSEALALAERIGDAANRVLCLTYLTVLNRKRGRTDEVSRYVALSRAACVDARMPAYAAVADANEAWLVGRQGDLSAAQGKAAAALEALRTWPLVYPLLWVALWPLVGAAAARGELEQAVGHARAMLQEPQQLPPEPLRRDLETAIAAWDTGSVAVARKQLDRAIALATGLGFL
jgi:predicted ATPase/class 3 adenylate cyclase